MALWYQLLTIIVDSLKYWGYSTETFDSQQILRKDELRDERYDKMWILL